MSEGKRAVLVSSRAKGTEGTKRVCLAQADLGAGAAEAHIDAAIFDEALRAMETGSLCWSESGPDDWRLVEPFSPKPRLVILGGGHIALPLVELAFMMGFTVAVCDDRPSFANRSRFPKADEVKCEFFDRYIDQLSLTSSTYVVIITRGHRHDLECYRKLALKELPYIGMIGSHRRIAGLKDELLEEGIPAAALARLHAPIGIDIGATSPEEIALSIIAQVVATRRTAGAPEQRSNRSAELDMTVLQELCADGREARALVTVIGTKGSVPRGVGAKMVVWPDGRILGSIGGGCSEGEVLVIARDIIREGGYRIHRVDMTGSVAEEEGMACGGIMDVLIEAI